MQWTKHSYREGYTRPVMSVYYDEFDRGYLFDGHGWNQNKDSIPNPDGKVFLSIDRLMMKMVQIMD